VSGPLDALLRRLVPLDERSLIASACRRARADDFGDESFREPLRRLLTSLEDESRLKPLGRIGARTDLTQMLVNRLEMQRDRVEHPEIAEADIRRPLFITGLPRSGSTFLHGLLAQDPASRVPIHWQTRMPSPPPTSARDEARRIRRTARQIRWFYRLAPEFRRIHPVEAEMPEECVVILSHAFLSFQFSSTFLVPSYQAWLEQQDLTPAYRLHRKFLQHLQWRRPGRGWVLKAPPHLPGLRALFAVYPDANVVVTHRDPTEVVASVSSLHYVLRRTFCSGIEARDVGPEVTEMLAGDIRRGLEARDAGVAAGEQFLDVRYEDLIADPMAVARRIYRHFDMPIDDEVEARMAAYVASTPKDKHGAHQYSLAQFALDEQAEVERYRAYRERFAV
jgi:sulfotransferase family protein